MKKYNEEQVREFAEFLTFKRLIKEVYPTSIVSVVSDTFDYWKAITKFAAKLKDEIMGRDGKVVFRPDTGDPVKVVVGYSVCDFEEEDWTGYDFIKMPNGNYRVNCGNRLGGPAEVTEAEIKGSIECLWDIFGGTITEQGYKVLDPHVGLIYGDNITLERAKAICEGLKAKGFASTNIVFGIGSFTYQYATRDTDGYAVKATYAKINNNEIEIFKAPKADASKKSAKGLTAVFKDENGELYLKDQATWEEVKNCEFVPVFENGKLLKDYTLQEVRDNLAKFV